jgi:hypothetical protein
MRLSDLNPNDVQLVEPAGPLSLSRIDPSEIQPVLAPVHPDVSKFESLARGAVQGTTLGFADELTGAGEALLDRAIGKNPEKSLPDLYRQHRDESRANFEAAQKANPLTYGTGELGGGVATALIPGLNIAKAPTLAARAARAAALGGVVGVGNSKADLTEGDVGGTAKDAAVGAAIAGAAQPVVEKVIEPAIRPVTEKANDVLNYILKKGNKTLLGVPEAATAHYLTDADAVNAQRPFEDVYDDVVKQVNGKRAAFDSAKEQLAGAKQGLDKLETNTRLGMQADRMDAQMDAQEAANQLRGAYQQSVESLRNAPKPTELKDDVVNAVSALRNRALEAEDKASQILEDQSVEVPIDPLFSKLNQIKERYGIGPGRDIFTGANKEAANELDQVAGDLLNLRDSQNMNVGQGNDTPPITTMTARDARTLLKSLNKRISFLDTSGGFMGPGSQALDNFRSYFRQELGNLSPEFDQTMRENVAPLFRLLSDADYYFGNEPKALSGLNNITSPANQYKRQILGKLGKETGLDFEQPIAQYETTQQLLKSPTQLAGLKENLPESTDQLRAQAQVQTLRRPAFQNNFLEDTLQNSPESQAVKSAEQQFEQSKSAYEPYSGMTEGTIQNQLKSVQRGNSIDRTRTLEQLGNETGNDYVAEMKNLGTKQAFDRDTTNGSRRVMLGTAIGAGVGSLTGHPALGSAAGAGVGAFIDKYGGQIAKTVLDSKLFTEKQLSRVAQSKFGDVIAKAASRGNQSLAIASFILGQNYPEFRAMMDHQDE